MEKPAGKPNRLRRPEVNARLRKIVSQEGKRGVELQQLIRQELGLELSLVAIRLLRSRIKKEGGTVGKPLRLGRPRGKSREEITQYLKEKHGEAVAQAFSRQTDVHKVNAVRNVMPWATDPQVADIVDLTVWRLRQIKQEKSAFPPEPEGQVMDPQDIIEEIVAKQGVTFRQMQAEIMRRTGLTRAVRTLQIIRARLKKGGKDVSRVAYSLKPLPLQNPETMRKYFIIMEFAEAHPLWTPRTIPREHHADFRQMARISLLRLAERANLVDPRWKGYVKERLNYAVTDYHRRLLEERTGLSATDAILLQSALKDRGKGRAREYTAQRLGKPVEKVQKVLAAFDEAPKMIPVSRLSEMTRKKTGV